MRVLLDTNVLVRAIAGPPTLANELLVEVTRPVHALIVSPYLLYEIGRVLRYPRLKKALRIEESQIDQFLGDLQAVAEMVVTTTVPPAIVTRDPHDDPIVAAAIAGRAECLCTLDLHLHQPDVAGYCKAHGVQVLGDVETLTRLRATA